MGDGERLYGDQAYWKDRYSKEDAEAFEWYQSYDHIKAHIKNAFPDTNGKVINLGCGSSRLPNSMAKDPDGGYKSITCVDYAMKLPGDEGGLVYKDCDVTKNLVGTFPEGSFKYAFDKGTLDSI